VTTHHTGSRREDISGPEAPSNIHDADMPKLQHRMSMQGTTSLQQLKKDGLTSGDVLSTPNESALASGDVHSTSSEPGIHECMDDTRKKEKL